MNEICARTHRTGLKTWHRGKIGTRVVGLHIWMGGPKVGGDFPCTACEFIVDFYHSIWIIISGSALFAQRAFCGYALFFFPPLIFPTQRTSFVYLHMNAARRRWKFLFFFLPFAVAYSAATCWKISCNAKILYVDSPEPKLFGKDHEHFSRDDDRLISSVSKSEGGLLLGTQLSLVDEKLGNFICENYCFLQRK